MEARRGGPPHLLESALRAELGRRRAEAHRLGQRVERDLSRAAHDLKAPLSAVKGYVDMMLRGLAGPLPPGASRYLERIREVVDRERHLIDDRLGPRRERDAIPLLDLARILGTAVERSARGLREKRLRLTLELPARGCPVAMSPGMVELLARRLVRHLVAVSSPGSAARLAVRDNLGRRWIELTVEGEGERPIPSTPDLRVALAAADRLGAHPVDSASPGMLRIDLPQEA